MDMATFFITHKIKGKKIRFRVFQRENGTWNIEFKRGQKRTLKTSDRVTAKIRAEIAIATYLDKVVVDIRKPRRKPLSEYLKDFLLVKDFRSIKTEKAYATAVNLLIGFVGDRDISEFRDDHIKQFKNLHRKKRLDTRPGKVSRISINSYLRHIKAVFRQAKDDGLIPSVPKIEFFQTSTRLPVILTEEDKKKILTYIKEVDPQFYRICLFALFTGCRRSEIVSARWEDFMGFTIRVTGKGDKERTVPLVPAAKEAMGPKQDSGPIFWQAHPDTYTHYFKRYAMACGIEGVSFHKMRHTAATSMLEAGVDINVVQKVLGHTDIATTKLYAQVMEKYMLSEMGKFGNL